MQVKRATRFLAAVATLLLTVWAPSGSAATAGDSLSPPEAVLMSYLRAAYARNSEEAYALLSKADTAVKSLESYRAQNGSFSGPVLRLSEVLASYIEFGEFSVNLQGRRASVSFSAALPDANSPAINSIVRGFDKDRLAQLDRQSLENNRQQLQQLASDGKLPFVTSAVERWELLLEEGQWRVFENWADAIEVHFEAIVMDDLEWRFEPVEEYVLAQPGQTIEMAYIARNTGNSETTGKARHIIGPDKHMEHLDIIACFCFFEQTLAPGEEIEMPLVFRVDYEAPESVKQYSVEYEFYPLDTFPDTAKPNDRLL